MELQLIYKCVKRFLHSILHTTLTSGIAEDGLRLSVGSNSVFTARWTSKSTSTTEDSPSSYRVVRSFSSADAGF